MIEDATGRPVLGYRAPDFSIRAESLWALEILAEEGLQYDSSIFPFRGQRYGIPNAFWEPSFVHCTLTFEFTPPPQEPHAVGAWVST